MIARMQPADDRGGLDHLGPEFLTWLWWRAEQGGAFTRPDEGDVFVHVEEHLEFRGERAAARRTVLRAGSPSASGEARAALQSGKLLTAARLSMARGEEEYAFTLRALDLQVSGLRLPAPSEPKAPARERLEEALGRLDAFWDDLDLCYATFLERRTDPGRWAEDVAAIRAWSA